VKKGMEGEIEVNNVEASGENKEEER